MSARRVGAGRSSGACPTLAACGPTAGPLVAATRAAAWAAASLTAHTGVNAVLLRRPPAAPPLPGELVSVLVPARDEAERIGGCLTSLLAQRGVDMEIVVLDDGSCDATAAVAQRVAAGDRRVRLMAGAPLPRGWLGKPHACAQLAGAARGSVLVFVDADVRIHPDGIARTVALLRGQRLALVSPYPRQEFSGAGARLIQPLLQWSWLTFLPLRLAEALKVPSLAAANGQLLACDAGAYRAVGGHTAVRDSVIEDVALARAFRCAGARAAVADGTHVATCRMYDSWEELTGGYHKSLWAAFGSPAGAVAALAVLAWLYLLPPSAAVAGLALRRRALAPVTHRAASALARAGLAGTVAGVAGRAVSAARTGGRVLDAVGHPASVAALGWLTIGSLRRRRRGQLTWRGRRVG